MYFGGHSEAMAMAAEQWITPSVEVDVVFVAWVKPVSKKPIVGAGRGYEDEGGWFLAMVVMLFCGFGR